MGRLTLVSVLVFFSLNAKATLAITEDQAVNPVAELVEDGTPFDVLGSLEVIDVSEATTSDLEDVVSSDQVEVASRYRGGAYRMNPGACRPAASLNAGRGCKAISGIASWYGPGFQGNCTAGGEHFNTNALTAASMTLKFNSLVRVTYHGRSVTVRINDKGPYVAGRVIDLSHAAAQALGISTGYVTLQVVRCG